MNEAYVGEEKDIDCADCVELTTHYLYHSGEWVCEECGAKQ